MMRRGVPFKDVAERLHVPISNLSRWRREGEKVSKASAKVAVQMVVGVKQRRYAQKALQGCWFGW
eukprot:1314970-Alexandrium_andersonii.AAC.1